MKPASNPADRRAFGRRESLHEAVVTFGGRHSEPCILRNVSDQGALIEFASDVPVAATFRLRIDSKDAEALCEVRHRNGKLIGVRFVGGNMAAVLARECAQTGVNDSGATAERTPRHLAPAKATTGGDIRRLLSGAQQQQQPKAE